MRRAVVRRCSSSRSATLVCDRLDGLRSSLRVEVQTTLDRRLEVLVELVEQRDAGRDVDPGDRRVVHVVQVLDQRPDRVAVGGDEDGLALEQVRNERGLPVGQGPACLLYTSDAADDLLCVDLG